jgi:hypothetical protein
MINKYESDAQMFEDRPEWSFRVVILLFQQDENGITWIVQEFCATM